MPENLLSYRGDPGLGSGSSDISIGGPGENLNVINRTLENIQLLGAQKNMKMFEQKVRDRDETNQLIAAGQVVLGAADPKDRDYFNKESDKLQDIFFKNPNILNDRKAFEQYQQQLTRVHEIATQAQSRYKSLADLRQGIAQEQLPWKRQAMIDHYNTQKGKSFWDEIDPFQQIHDLDMDSIKTRGVNAQTSTYNDPTDPTKSYTETKYNYQDILKNKAQDFVLQNQFGYDQSLLASRLQGLSQPQLAQFADGINARIAQYNQLNGLAKGQQGYVDPLGEVVDDGNGNKHLIINESAPEVAAKVALASQQNLYAKNPLLKPEELVKHGEEEQKIGIEKQRVGLEGARLSIEAKKVGLEADKAKAYIDHLKALTNKTRSQTQQQATDVSKQMQSYWNNLNPITETKGGFLGIGGTKVEGAPVIMMDNLPPSYRFISGPVVNDKGKVSIGEIKPFEEDGKTFYRTKYVDPASGSDLTDTLKDKYSQSKANGYTGSYINYLKDLKNKGLIELVLQGENGSATETSIYTSAKTISEQGGKKGEENITNPDEQSDE